ncbi:uncharacterized protein LOC129091383 isoform X2 [Anoplopoma fimbria]|uniref:uncharacterized protein LOC129091383 isoform X2 n=1 Tax=Anoplopoma fimbria TaxID=229290 RepID=UPI0023ED3401|nr:uncharacterized protein LOC129091383 isoform X2 [Anoplopoma fimbria]
MRGIPHLLLLAELVLLARCQNPQVSISPTLKQIFSGDLFILRCNSGSGVKWYFNGTEQVLTGGTWKIEFASPMHSGFYQCESNGVKSDSFYIEVLDYVPSASLTIKTGQPVVRNGGSVVLQLGNEDGLKGWRCWVFDGGSTYMILLRLKNDSVRVVFQPNRLKVQQTIFWCTDTQERRSNQIMVRTSEKDISLEMYPLPAVVGESLTLKCLAWGADQISRTIFYKDDEIILDSLSSTYKIPKVTELAKGRYKCDATFTYMRDSVGPAYKVVSDIQEVFVQALPMQAFLSTNIGMSCYCSLCPSDSTYHWYHKDYGQSWAFLDSSLGFMMPKASGTYACRAVWAVGRSYLSNVHTYQPPTKSILIGVFSVLVILGAAAVVFYIWTKRRNTTGPIYEDVPLRSRDTGDDKYEMLQKGAHREGEYDTIQPEAPGRQKKEGEYEALKKEEVTEGTYHTLGMVGAAAEAPGRQEKEGEYEALKKEEVTGGTYHTLGMVGAAAAPDRQEKEGEYEALKKEEMTGGVQHPGNGGSSSRRVRTRSRREGKGLRI